VLFSRDRGKYIRPVMPRPGAPFRLAIDATLREAAKQQFYRRKCAAAEGKEPKKIYLEYSDVRAKLMSRRAGCLVRTVRSSYCCKDMTVICAY
jgi:Mg-chelatase subunit ChlD